MSHFYLSTMFSRFCAVAYGSGLFIAHHNAAMQEVASRHTDSYFSSKAFREFQTNFPVPTPVVPAPGKQASKKPPAAAGGGLARHVGRDVGLDKLVLGMDKSPDELMLGRDMRRRRRFQLDG